MSTDFPGEKEDIPMRSTLLAAAAALSMAAGASLAQPAPAPAGAPGSRAGMHMQRPDPAQMAERHAQHLRDTLQLRRDQEPALNAFVAAMQPSTAEQGRGREAMRGLTTPQRLDRMQARMAERETRFRRQSEAIRRFYAQLTPAQQKAFDALPMMGHMAGRRGMDGMGGMHGGRGMMHGPGPDGRGPAPER